ncbi:MAG: adenosylcobinamide-GDP ribazoletransferase [Corynebacterium sp.]|nr:adenosylcobinamide-GDP ribazoletransferase [Corynebacterium sp.]
MSDKAGPTTDPDTPRPLPAIKAAVEGIRTIYSWLTIIPIRLPADTPFDRALGRRAMAALPLVALPFSLLALVAAAFATVTTPLLAAVLCLCFWALFNRAMHWDGLGDIADALGSWATPERAREILRDPTAGPFAIITLILVALLQVSAIAEILTDLNMKSLLALLLLPVLARLAAMQLTLTRFAPLSPTGFGSLVIGVTSKRTVILWGVLATLAAGLISPWLLPLPFALIGVATIFGTHVSKRLGGLNGDVLGAAIEITTALGALYIVVTSGE